MSQTKSVPSNRNKRKEIALLAAAGLAVFVLLLVFACHFLGIHSRMDLVAYRQMWREDYHPIWKDLALRRIKKGDDIESVLKKRAPLRREDPAPYTKLVYTEGGAYPGLTLMARDGQLIAATAGARKWRHVFFDTPDQMGGFEEIYVRYRTQRRLEKHAYRIHHAVTRGQDVFLSRHIVRSDEADAIAEKRETMQQLRDVYGTDRFNVDGLPRVELDVEVTEVVYGNPSPGTILKIPEDTCDKDDLAEPETIFLHFEDGGMIFARAQGEPLYITVPKRALDWYQALTPEEIQEFESRWSTE